MMKQVTSRQGAINNCGFVMVLDFTEMILLQSVFYLSSPLKMANLCSLLSIQIELFGM